ncbi:MAG: TerB family tellurite resistance protein [Halofilum sp. (in: g-proteobacteria)]|nr:TerB family tellurite resistance protein [Halofilum sp. (in: g-proteobacteria)]
MLPRLQEFFRERLAAEADDDPVHRRNLAAAALLIEIARADFEFDAEEQRAIESLLTDTLELDEEEVAELVRLATEESREATSLHQFTRLINDSHSIAQKQQLMEQLWRVAFADGRIDRYEEQLLRRIADLLHLRHKEFMQAKHAAAGE